MKHDLTLLTSVETPYVPRLPFIARTRGGITFDPAKKRWTYREGVKTVSINFDLIHGLSIVLQQSLKAVLLWYVENSSASHMENMFRRMVHFSHFFAQRATSPLNELTSIEVHYCPVKS